MRLALFAPTARSLYSRLVAHALHRLPGVELAGIYVRGLWSLNRIRTDLRREGPRLLQKIYNKLILPESLAVQEKNPLAAMGQTLGLEDRTLLAFGRRTRIPVHRVKDFNSEASESALRALAPDLIVFTGGGLIRKNILTIPVAGVLNCHSGLLPRYRGMDTLEWTILEARDGIPQIGLTLHFMDAGVDTGPILKQYHRRVSPGESLVTIRQQLEPEMVRLVIEGVRDLQRGSLEAQAQDPAAGRQYFVIHPRLGKKADEKLMQMK
jgi:methionyl-tRNA formyltransferase